MFTLTKSSHLKERERAIWQEWWMWLSVEVDYEAPPNSGDSINVSGVLLCFYYVLCLCFLFLWVVLSLFLLSVFVALEL